MTLREYEITRILARLVKLKKRGPKGTAQIQREKLGETKEQRIKRLEDRLAVLVQEETNASVEQA